MEVLYFQAQKSSGCHLALGTEQNHWWHPCRRVSLFFDEEEIVRIKA